MWLLWHLVIFCFISFLVYWPIAYRSAKIFSSCASVIITRKKDVWACTIKYMQWSPCYVTVLMSDQRSLLTSIWRTDDHLWPSCLFRPMIAHHPSISDRCFGHLSDQNPCSVLLVFHCLPITGTMLVTTRSLTGDSIRRLTGLEKQPTNRKRGCVNNQWVMASDGEGGIRRKTIYFNGFLMFYR